MPRTRPARTPLISAVQAAQLLGVSRATVLRRVREGSLRAAFQAPGGNGAYLFDPADILAYLHEQSIEAEDGAAS